MRVVLALCVLAVALAACDFGSAALNAQDKARFMTETIEEGGACAAFRNRLAEHSTDAVAIDLIYNEAKKAGCLKRDI
jgi:hypothetical protein